MAVYCSSSDGIDSHYFSLATEIGKKIVNAGYDLIYGGGKVGMMGHVAQSVKTAKGKVIGVIPEYIYENVPHFKEMDELIITPDMPQRKSFMETKADGFLILPGGFGTLEELLQVITLKQLGYHNKPIGILNYQNYFTPLLSQFDQSINLKFAKERYKNLYFISESIDSILDYFLNYIPEKQESKWFQ